MNRAAYARIHRRMTDSMGDSAHDAEHVHLVLHIALECAAYEQNVDTDVLIAACLLHDIARKAQNANPFICHAQLGGEMAYQFLMADGWDEEKARHVQQCILTHRYRSASPPETLEAKLLFDADKVDVCGAMGIARTLLCHGKLGEPLYQLDEQGLVSDGSDDVCACFFQEYCFKLDMVYDSFYTTHARAMARKRRLAAQVFYENLLEEARTAYGPGKDKLAQLLGPES
jgi:uncharacterized protein